MAQIINHFAYIILAFSIGHFIGSRRRVPQNKDDKNAVSIPDAVFKRNKQKRKPVSISEYDQWKREQNLPSPE